MQKYIKCKANEPMDTAFYLDKFIKSAGQLDMAAFNESGLEVKAGMWRTSVVLKIQNPLWLNQSAAARPFEESIFFSVWVSEQAIRESKLYYNIHALKLRELNGYRIKSREFAEAFRLRFKPFEQYWPNVSVNFGPLTLMEGYKDLNTNTIEKDIQELADNFLTIQFIIEELLAERKK